MFKALEISAAPPRLQSTQKMLLYAASKIPAFFLLYPRLRRPYACSTTVTARRSAIIRPGFQKLLIIAEEGSTRFSEYLSTASEPIPTKL